MKIDIGTTESVGGRLGIDFEEGDENTISIYAASNSNFYPPSIAIHHVTLDQVKQLRDACQQFIESEGKQEARP